MNKAVKYLMTASAILVLPGQLWAQQPDIGKFEYHSSCAPCHGDDGKGNGPLRADLKTAPPDLTILAKRNNGVFPFKSIYEIIDGRQKVLAHGTRDMPIWGMRYSVGQIQRAMREYAPLDPEYVVRDRILAIIDYLNRIQEKN
jgi:mono/diheme cytochrome c family protein